MAARLGRVGVPARRREMVPMQGNERSSLTTLNHRWPVERRNARAGSYVRRWATSESLSAGDRIPTAAFASDVPTEPKWTDALVETVALFWTEGRFASGRKRALRGAVSRSPSPGRRMRTTPSGSDVR